MQQVSTDTLNFEKGGLLIAASYSYFSRGSTTKKKGLSSPPNISLIISNCHYSPRKSSALSPDKNFHAVAAASTIPRAIAGSGMQFHPVEPSPDGQVVLTLCRFSCCSKVFPCDKYAPRPIAPPFHCRMLINVSRCHDAETDHPNEHANRMICGYCSREQIYRPENCGICKAILIGKAGSGFWEGGKGTRNRALMSRKGMCFYVGDFDFHMMSNGWLDPRKYKRRGGNAPTSSSSKRK